MKYLYFKIIFLFFFDYYFFFNTFSFAFSCSIKKIIFSSKYQKFNMQIHQIKTIEYPIITVFFKQRKEKKNIKINREKKKMNKFLYSTLIFIFISAVVYARKKQKFKIFSSSLKFFYSYNLFHKFYIIPHRTM